MKGKLAGILLTKAADIDEETEMFSDDTTPMLPP